MIASRLTLKSLVRALHTKAKFSVRNFKLHKLEQRPSTEVELGREDGLKIFNQMVTIRRMETAANTSQSKEPVIHSSKDQKNAIAGRPDDLYRYLWLKCAGHEVEVLNSYEKFLKLAAKNLDIEFVKTEEPFRNIKRRTLLASRHVHKKYRVQYEMRTYYRNILFKNLTGSTKDTFLEYVERNLPEGVFLIAEKHQLAELPFSLEEKDNKEEEAK